MTWQTIQVKLHAWFAGLDWANLARTKAAFIPELDSPTDTAYFAPKPVRVHDCTVNCLARAEAGLWALNVVCRFIAGLCHQLWSCVHLCLSGACLLLKLRVSVASMALDIQSSDELGALRPAPLGQLRPFVLHSVYGRPTSRRELSCTGVGGEHGAGHPEQRRAGLLPPGLPRRLRVQLLARRRPPALAPALRHARQLAARRLGRGQRRIQHPRHTLAVARCACTCFTVDTLMLQHQVKIPGCEYESLRTPAPFAPDRALPAPHPARPPRRSSPPGVSVYSASLSSQSGMARSWKSGAKERKQSTARQAESSNQSDVHFCGSAASTGIESLAVWASGRVACATEG